ncbi:MAG: hypothetical protein IAX21_06835 [Candidatus Bathyarchaeota archaeon]|nr:MAG: hypothetical protein IAX21_06835 [Candidatus Bathyarchaeota archaeon]
MKNGFMLFLYSIGRWLLFVVLAIINGSLRNFVYASKVGEQKGHMISSVVAVYYTLAVTYLFVIATKSTATLTELLFIGAFWVTIRFCLNLVLDIMLLGILGGT